MANTARKSDTGRFNEIGKFFEGLLNEKTMIKAARRMKIENFEDFDKVQMGLALKVAFDDYATKKGLDIENDFCECPDCKGIAPDDFDACPFCGSEGNDDETNDVAKPPVMLKEEPDANPKKAKSAPTPPESDPAPAKKPKTSKADKRAKPSDSTELTTSIVTTEQTLVPVKGKGAKMGPILEKDLDSAVSDVLFLKQQVANNFYTLGQRIKVIFDGGMWKLRMKEDGATRRWSTWEAFCSNELGMVPGEAYKLKEIVEHFDEKQAAKLGQSKLGLLITIPKSVRDELAREAEEKGLTRKELRERVRQEVETNPEVEKSRTARQKAGAKGGKKKAAKHASEVTLRRDDKITIASIVGSKQIPLFAKPESLRGIVLKDCKRAQTIGSKPFGRFELANDVSMWFELIKTDKGLALKIRTMRD